MKKYTLILIFLFYPIIILANIAPVARGTKNSGPLILISEQAIGIVKERLKITFSPKKTRVHVMYLLKNYGNTRTITFAFPQNYFERAGIKKDHGNRLKIIQIKMRKKRVKFRIKKVLSKIKGENYGVEFKEAFKRATVFFTFQFKIKKMKTILLSIDYEIKNFQSGEWTYGYRPTWSFKSKEFEYNLKTGKRWKGGIIKDFEARVILKDCQPKEIRLRPGSFKTVRGGVCLEGKGIKSKKEY